MAEKRFIRFCFEIGLIFEIRSIKIGHNVVVPDFFELFSYLVAQLTVQSTGGLLSVF